MINVRKMLARFEGVETLLARIDCELLYVPFLERVCVALSRCADRGAHYYATSGFRSWELQAKRHRAYKEGTGTRAAPAGYSAHQFGCAIDFAADSDLGKRGLQASWKLPHYRVLVEEVERVGLVSGSRFNDTPHVQIPRFVSGKSMQPLRAAFKAGKLPGVWDYLDSLPLFS